MKSHRKGMKGCLIGWKYGIENGLLFIVLYCRRFLDSFFFVKHSIELMWRVKEQRGNVIVKLYKLLSVIS